MPENIGYPMEIAQNPNEFTIEKLGKLIRGDDRVSPSSAPTSDVDLDFDVMLKGVSGNSEPMKLTDAKKSQKSNGKAKY